MSRPLLVLGRKQPGTLALTDFNTIVSDLADFYGHVLPRNIGFKIRPSPRPALVVAEPTLLQQVVMNLVFNAHDATPNGGRLRLRLALRTSAPRPKSLSNRA